MLDKTGYVFVMRKGVKKSGGKELRGIKVERDKGRKITREKRKLEGRGKNGKEPDRKKRRTDGQIHN